MKYNVLKLMIFPAKPTFFMYSSSYKGFLISLNSLIYNFYANHQQMMGEIKDLAKILKGFKLGINICLMLDQSNINNE